MIELQTFHPRNHEIARVLVMVAAEIFMVCATVLLLFVYFSLPVQTATAAAIPILFFGSLFCWRSLTAAQTIFLASMLVMQLVMLSRAGELFGSLFLIFSALDIVALFVLFQVRQPKVEIAQ